MAAASGGSQHVDRCWCTALSMLRPHFVDSIHAEQTNERLAKNLDSITIISWNIRIPAMKRARPYRPLYATPEFFSSACF